ncbi:right-handed parallel beta-helix repeat-containing protein [Deinococcus marmoris]
MLRDVRELLSDYIDIPPLSYAAADESNQVYDETFRGFGTGIFQLNECLFEESTQGIDVDGAAYVSITNSQFKNNDLFDVKLRNVGRSVLNNNKMRRDKMSENKEPAFDVELGSGDVEDNSHVGDRAGFKIRVKGHGNVKRNQSIDSNVSPDLIQSIKELRLAVNEVAFPTIRESGETLIENFEEARRAGENGESQLIRLRDWANEMSALITTGAVIYALVVAVARMAGVELPSVPDNLRLSGAGCGERLI